jgi:hypothetical protein
MESTRSRFPCWQRINDYTLEAAEIDSSGDLGPMSAPATVDVTSNQLVGYGDFGGSSPASDDLYYYLPCDDE